MIKMFHQKVKSFLGELDDCTAPCTPTGCLHLVQQATGFTRILYKLHYSILISRRYKLCQRQKGCRG